MVRFSAVELRQLQCFVAVADELSFSRAADRLLYATSNVSQHVRQLERELEVSLFDRTNRQVRLTPAGDMLVVEARRLLLDAGRLRDLARDASQGRAGTVSASYCPGTSDLVAILMQGLADGHPDIHVAFQVRQTAEVTEAVMTGESMIGIARTTAPPLASLVLTSHPKSLVAMPEGHPLAAQAEVRLADLSGQDMILIDRAANAHFHDELVEYFRRHGVTPRYRTFFIRTVEQLMDLVATGQGLTLATGFETARYPRRGTVVRPLAGPPQVTEHSLLWRAADTSPVVAVVTQVARQLLPTFARL
jgi:DNA-binding transcriptional LysR family regulator